MNKFDWITGLTWFFVLGPSFLMLAAFFSEDESEDEKQREPSLKLVEVPDLFHCDKEEVQAIDDRRDDISVHTNFPYVTDNLCDQDKVVVQNPGEGKMLVDPGHVLDIGVHYGTDEPPRPPGP